MKLTAQALRFWCDENGQVSARIRKLLPHYEFPDPHKLIKQTSSGRRRVDAPKPTTPPPEGECWIYDTTSDQWFTRPKKILKPMKPSTSPDEKLQPLPARITDSQKTAGTLPGPPATPASSKQTSTRVVRRKPAPSPFIKKDPIKNSRPHSDALPKSDNGLHRVQGSRVEKLVNETFHERKIRCPQGRYPPKYINGKFQVVELYEKEDKADEGFMEKLHRQQMKEKMQKETDELFE